MIITDDTGREFRSKMEACRVPDVIHRRFYISELLHQDIEITEEIRAMRKHLRRLAPLPLLSYEELTVLARAVADRGEQAGVRYMERSPLRPEEPKILASLHTVITEAAMSIEPSPDEEAMEWWRSQQ